MSHPLSSRAQILTPDSFLSKSILADPEGHPPAPVHAAPPGLPGNLEIPFCVIFLGPQTGGLRTTETHGLTALEAGSLKSRCHQGHAAFEGAMEGSTPSLSPSFWQVPWLVAT